MNVKIEDVIAQIDKKPSWTNLELKALLLKLVVADEKSARSLLPVD